MTTKLRAFVGGPILVAGLWFLTAVSAAPPAVSQGSYKKAAEVDLSFLNKRLEELVAAEEVKDAQRKPALMAAMLLAAYGEASGDAALKADALKVAEALAKKDVKAAAGLAKKLVLKPGTPGKGDLPKLDHKAFDLEMVMQPFRAGKTGGMNIQNDIKDLLKNEGKIEAAAMEVLATRTAILGDYMLGMPNDKATANQANKDKWAKWSKETTELSKQLADEASKGKTANVKNMAGLLKKLDAKCSDCHSEFRLD